MADVNKNAKATKRNERTAQPSSPCKKLKTDQEHVSQMPSTKLKTDPANLVPIGTLPVKLLEPEDGDSVIVDLASVPSRGAGASASTRGNAMGIAKPWGVETPEIAPQLPGDDASPSPIEVQKCVKAVAAYVVTTLPTFFKDNSK